MYVRMPESVIYTYMYVPMYLCVFMYVCRPVYSVCVYVRTYGCMNATMDVLLNTIFQHKLDYFLVALKLSSINRKYSKIATYIDTSIALFRPLKLAH
jgi:hypothetical protein